MNAMGQGFDIEYTPNQQLVDIYQKRFEQYKVIGGFIEAQVAPVESSLIPV